MKNIPREYTARLEKVFGKNLLAVILYGSAARGEYRKGASDINLLVILENSTPRTIFEAGKAARALAVKGRIETLIMTREEFLSSADVFPLEYSDIQDCRTVLYGEEKILELSVSKANLRYQLEEKLRGAVADVRTMLLVSAGSEKKLGRLLRAWPGAGGVLFRGLLRLKDAALPQDSGLLAEEAGRLYGVCVTGFSALNRFRAGKKENALFLAESLLETLKALARAVDALSGGAA
jgi:predicted nucleotidyltransferase